MNLRKFYLARAIGFLIVVGIIFIYFVFFKDNYKVIVPSNINIDVKNMSFNVDNEDFVLEDGLAENSYNGDMASKNKLSIFGEPTYGDLDGDGDAEAALILINEKGGSGVFYYAVLAINLGDSYQASNALLLGDRIAPQTVEIHDGQVVYNYAIRGLDEAMTVQPSIAKSLRINFDKTNNTISEATAVEGADLTNDNNDQVFCTMDAKQCPDGSYVGRIAPDCDFAPCPKI